MRMRFVIGRIACSVIFRINSVSAATVILPDYVFGGRPDEHNTNHARDVVVASSS